MWSISGPCALQKGNPATLCKRSAHCKGHQRRVTDEAPRFLIVRQDAGHRELTPALSYQIFGHVVRVGWAHGILAPYASRAL